jgi:hypothetical protein
MVEYLNITLHWILVYNLNMKKVNVNMVLKIFIDIRENYFLSSS